MRYELDQAGNRELAKLLEELEADRPTNIGFPGALDFSYEPLWPAFKYLLNNVGDSYVDPTGRNHTKAMERQVVEFFADLFRAPVDDRWGYVTSGGSEGTLEGLYLARKLHPGALVYRSAAAHYSVEKALDLLGMQAVTVRAEPKGEMDYDDLHALVRQHRDRAAIIVANIGTTMTEAVDDVGRIHDILDDLVVQRRYIHADAALAGIPLALLAPRPRFDLADGAHSISVSGHKFVGSPFPCGVVITRRSIRDQVRRPVSYTGSPDTTITGSRSGHAPLLLWYAIRTQGTVGFRRRAEQARQVAEYAERQLALIDWPAWRNPHALTVVLKTPPGSVTARWTLCSSNGWSHVICMPGISHAQIDAFVSDLQAVQNGDTALPFPASRGLRLRAEVASGAA